MSPVSIPLSTPRRLPASSPKPGPASPDTHAAPHDAVAAALRAHTRAVDPLTCTPDEERPFFVCNLGVVRSQYARFRALLPRVHPYYAVKCHPDPAVLSTLASLGAGFDCASAGEIDTVLALGVAPSRIVYANPCKHVLYVRHARRLGVDLTTVDSVEEVAKLALHHPDTDVLVRIATNDAHAQCLLSDKFGALLAEAADIVAAASSLGVSVVGVSFHVGSGASDHSAWAEAVADARSVFDLLEAAGFAPDLLDVGGGFVLKTFDGAAAALNAALDQHFPDTVSVIAEPGRYFAEEAFTLAACVVGVRGGPTPQVYINDGVYGNLNCVTNDHQDPEMEVVTARGRWVLRDGLARRHACVVWGPTCDSLDRIGERVLAHPVEAGDWVCFPNAGAYTGAARSGFNGFSTDTRVVYVE